MTTKEKIIEILEIEYDVKRDGSSLSIASSQTEWNMRVADKIIGLVKQEIVKENKKLYKIASRYAETINLMSNGMPYEELPKRLK